MSIIHIPRNLCIHSEFSPLLFAALRIEIHFVEMELLRYQIIAAIGVSFLSFWLALVKCSDKTLNPLVLYAPVWSVFLFVLYASGSIILGLVNLKDSPEAAAEIEREIVEAKAEMKKRGVLKDR